MKQRMTALLMSLLCVCACAAFLAGCSSSDTTDIQGQWKVGDSDVTCVFTDTELKMVGSTFGYTLDTGAKTISYTNGGLDAGSAEYSFSDDKQTLTLVEDSGNGDGEKKTTTFTKIDNDTSAEPTANGETGDDSSDE